MTLSIYYYFRKMMYYMVLFCQLLPKWRGITVDAIKKLFFLKILEDIINKTKPHHEPVLFYWIIIYAK